MALNGKIHLGDAAFFTTDCTDFNFDFQTFDF